MKYHRHTCTCIKQTYVQLMIVNVELYLDSRTLHWGLVKFISRSLNISFIYVSTYNVHKTKCRTYYRNKQKTYSGPTSTGMIQ